MCGRWSHPGRHVHTAPFSFISFHWVREGMCLLWMLLSTRGRSGWDFNLTSSPASIGWLRLRWTAARIRTLAELAPTWLWLSFAFALRGNKTILRAVAAAGGDAGVSILVGFAADLVSHRSRCRQELADADTDVRGQLAGKETFILRRLREPTPSSSQRGAQGPSAGAVRASIRAVYFTQCCKIKLIISSIVFVLVLVFVLVIILLYYC